MTLDDGDRQLAHRTQGFFVVRRLLSPARRAELADACDHVLGQVRAASLAEGHTSTHVAGLLAPEYFVDRPEALGWLSDYASSREVLGLVHDLGKVGEGLLNLRDAQYFHEPSARDDDGDWHRDGDGAATPGADDAASRPTLIRFRVAFASDDHLEIVPGSQLRADMPAERRVIKGSARAAALGTDAIRVALEPGDVCVFDTWSIHRARYRSDRPRRTLDLLFGFGPRRRVDFGALQALLPGR